MTKKRIAFFDIAKCFAIFLIVLGHVGLEYPSTLNGGMPTKFVHFAFTCHLPVFFVASGYFLKLDTPLNKSFFKKSFRNLITPYIVTCIIIIIGCVITGELMGVSKRDTFFNWVWASLYCAGALSSLTLFSVDRIGGIWFLLALFWARIIILITQRLPKPTLWIVGLFIIGWVSATYVCLPWSIQAGICACAFVYAGAKAREYKILERDGVKNTVATVVCTIIWAMYIILTNRDMSFATFYLPNGLGDVVGSFAAAYVVFRACRFVENHFDKITRFTAWVGRNTLVIFCMHIAGDDSLLGVLWIPFVNWCASTFPAFGWVVFLVVRLALISAVCGVVYLIPKLNAVYFPSKRKPKRIAPDNAEVHSNSDESDCSLGRAKGGDAHVE